MMKVIDYLFYKIYKLINFLGNEDFYPEANTWFISSMFLWLNMLTILNLIEFKIGRALTNTMFVIVFYVLYLAITYIYFLKNDRYKQILAKYDTHSDSKKLFGSIIVGIYIIITLVFHFYMAEKRREVALLSSAVGNVSN